MRDTVFVDIHSAKGLNNINTYFQTLYPEESTHNTIHVCIYLLFFLLLSRKKIGGVVYLVCAYVIGAKSIVDELTRYFNCSVL